MHPKTFTMRATTRSNNGTKDSEELTELSYFKFWDAMSSQYIFFMCPGHQRISGYFVDIGQARHHCMTFV